MARLSSPLISSTLATFILTSLPKRLTFRVSAQELLFTNYQKAHTATFDDIS